LLVIDMRKPVRLLPSSGGFTLLELLTTITIAGIVVSIAMPGMSGFLRNQQVVAAADSLRSAVAQARTTAAASNGYVTVAAIDGHWRNGWRVFREGGTPDGAYVAGTDTLIAQYDPLRAGMTVSATTSPAGLGYISFSPVGYSQSLPGRTQMSMTVGFQHGKSSRVVEINLLGRARVCNPDFDNLNCAMPKP
jgi:type IV fimbrial biogenesis protein FimT